MRTPHVTREAIDVDVVAFLGTIKDSLSATVDAMRAMALNQVLGDFFDTIPTTGVWSRDFVVPYASVALYNGGPAPVVLTADSPQGSAPAAGGAAGQSIPAGGAVINISGRTLSIYGAAGTQLSVQVFEKPQPPSYSPASTIVTAATAQLLTRFAEDNTPLGAGATVNGAWHDTAAAPAARFRAFAASDVAGNLQIQQSDDGVTGYITQPNVGILADLTQGTVLESEVTLRYVRAVVTNGAAPQTAFKFNTALVAI